MTAPTMGRLKRCSYTHKAMVDLMVAHPEMSGGELAAYFGYTPGWFSNIQASVAFQDELELRRHEVVNEELKASLEERFRGLTLRGLTVLQEALDKPDCSPNVALKSVELGAKALGIGGNAPPPPAEVGRLERLADRLLMLRSQRLAQPALIDVTPTEVDNGTEA